MPQPLPFTMDLNSTFTTLFVLFMVGKLAAWVWAQMKRNPLIDAAESAQAAAASSASAAAAAADSLQLAREVRAITTETRDMVRRQREDGIRHDGQTARVLEGVAKSVESMDRLNGTLSELVGEIRGGAMRRAS